MIIRHPLVTLNLLVIAVALVIAGNLVLLRPLLPAWLPALTWEIVAPVLTCPYLMPPECVDPIPGL
jgi:hypothetical protein